MVGNRNTHLVTREKSHQLKRLSRRTALKGIGGVALGAAASEVAVAHEGASGGDDERIENGETEGTSGSDEGGGRTNDVFTAHLLPTNAVPPEYQPASCDAEGTARFRLAESAEELGYELRLDGIEGVSGIHLHRGSPGENGPHVANLYDGDPTGSIGEFFSLSAQGVVTPDDFDEAFEGSFATMANLIRDGKTYLQVHRGPEGKEVIRGPLE